MECRRRARVARSRGQGGFHRLDRGRQADREGRSGKRWPTFVAIICVKSQRDTREVWPVTVQRRGDHEMANLRGDYLREVTA
jgi:hypothetical protein